MNKRSLMPDAIGSPPQENKRAMWIADEQVFVTSSEATAENFPALFSFLWDHLWLILCGFASELFYVYYLMRSYPLIHHELNLTDMGLWYGYPPAGFLTFLLFFSLLFLLFFLACWQTRRLQSRASLWLILGFGALFSLTNVFVYPINAIDIYGYIAESATLLYHHANPMVVAATHYASDPLIYVAGSFVSVPSPYGPLEIVINAFPTLLGGHSVLADMIYVKLLCVLVLFAAAYLLYRILQHFRPVYAYMGVLALLWNPYVLLEYVVNAHNDVIMMFFVLLAVYMVSQERYALAFLAVLLSALVKYSSLPLIPLFLLYGLVHVKDGPQRLIYLARISVGTLLVIFVFVWPFWAGPQTFLTTFSTTQFRLNSFIMMLDTLGGPFVGHSQVIGLTIFAGCYLVLLGLATRSLNAFLLACFLTLFLLLAFAVSYIQVWYIGWPCLFALVLPWRRLYMISAILAYTATMAELVHAYIMPWGVYANTNANAVANSTVYLFLFGPVLVLLAWYALRVILARYARLSGDL